MLERIRNLRAPELQQFTCDNCICRNPAEGRTKWLKPIGNDDFSRSSFIEVYLQTACKDYATIDQCCNRKTAPLRLIV